jgi:hypothetical protein
LTKAYLEKGWKIIAAVRDPSKMKIEGDVMVVKLEVGEKEDAKKVRPLSASPPFSPFYETVDGCTAS